MTPARPPWRVERLDAKAHDRSAFACGAPELDRYIREQASQDARRDISRIFVALDPALVVVRGFYSLSAASFRRDGLPAAQAKRLPHYPVPAVLLGRLAVDDLAKGRGLGAYLLTDALNRVLLASQALAVHALIVDARDSTALAFYAKYGFIPFTDNARRRFLPLATVRQLVAS